MAPTFTAFVSGDGGMLVPGAFLGTRPNISESQVLKYPFVLREEEGGKIAKETANVGQHVAARGGRHDNRANPSASDHYHSDNSPSIENSMFPVRNEKHDGGRE